MICELLICQPIDVCAQQNSHLAGLQLADWADGESSLDVDILVASDYHWDIVTGAVSKGASGPTAKLGWVLSGPIARESVPHCAMNLVTTHFLRADTQLEVLDDRLRLFWELEALGI